ncbi:hypothetical protein Syun_020879 [Stephania yunnanensis]|uniref:Uncharacterized protein n=1 Tax=Stephania yunnanensis TaxID=152371 RepID=A0AAP0NNM8_9MAGN
MKGKGKAKMPSDPSQEEQGKYTKVCRRTWIHIEEASLVHAMYKMVSLRVYKCDNEFKLGYLNHLEEMLKTFCPISGIKAGPYIDLMGEYAVALEDALEEVEKIDSSSESDCEVECTIEMSPAAEDVEITYTISRSRTTTPDGNENPSKKKKNVSGYTYL